MIPYNSLPETTVPPAALLQPWLSTGIAAGFAVNAIGPRQLATAAHTGLGVGSTVYLNDGSTRHVIGATSAPDGADVTVLTVDSDLATWSTVTPITDFKPLDAMFIGAGDTGNGEVRDGDGQLHGWFWQNDAGTLRWTQSETKYAKSTLEQYEVGFDSDAGSFAMTNGDSGGGYYVEDSGGQWHLQGVGSGIITYNGSVWVNGVCASQFRSGTGVTNVTYQTNVMMMPRDWLQTVVPTTGDANLDGAVDFQDLVILAHDFWQEGTWSQGDFNGDGHVNFDDLIQLAQHYGGPSSDIVNLFASLHIAIPEPASTLAIAGLPVALARRRRAVA